MKTGFRFKTPDPSTPHMVDVLAKRKTTGKFEKIGHCHSASVLILRQSCERAAELIQFTYKL